MPIVVLESTDQKAVLGCAAARGPAIACWLGQAGFLLRWGDVRLAIDPYLSDSLAVKYRGTRFPHRRMMPSPIDPRNVTPLDAVFCTHSHSDHMDPETLAPLAAVNPACRFIVPRSARGTALERGVPAERLITADAGESGTLPGGVRWYALASAHEELATDAAGQQRFLGYVIEFAGLRVYHSGDCVPYPGLGAELRRHAVHVAILPVNGRDAQRSAAGIPGNAGDNLMKARLVPLYFDPGRDADFDRQLTALRELLADQAELLEPRPLGAALPEAEAVLFPQLLGVAYRQREAFHAIRLPILLVTSEFGTLSMWDWEIAEYLRSEGVATIGPYNLDQTRKIVAALGVKRQLRQTKFLVYQDDPGEGFQAPIFKRFYWWEDECTQRMQQKFGLTIIKRGFRELGARAKALPDDLADQTWRGWDVPCDGLSDRARRSAAKIYLAVRDDLDADPAIGAVGINCLNESHFCDSTPCLAWNMLYRERGLIWGCEADTVAMLTKYVLHKSLGAPIMMTNMYPFLLGNAALKHERIERFPQVEAEPENHILVAHCGYLGVIPQPFATEWTLRKKVLAIVDQNAVAIDARLPIGDITLAKLLPTMDRLSMTEGRLVGYAQFPGLDCLNGGMLRVRDGRKFMQRLGSHHYLILMGHHGVDLGFVGQVFGLAVEEMC